MTEDTIHPYKNSISGNYFTLPAFPVPARSEVKAVISQSINHPIFNTFSFYLVPFIFLLVCLSCDIGNKNVFTILFLIS